MAHKVTILGVPYDADPAAKASAARAPAEIRKALKGSPASLTSRSGLALAGHADLSDMGDLGLSGWPAAEAEVVIRAAAEGLVDKGQRVLALGGGQSISHPLIAAHAANGPIDVLHIDAFPDLVGEGGISPFVRLIEEGLVRHLVQIGIRAIDPGERAELARLGITCVEMKDWAGVPEIAFGGRFYLTLDLHALDPAHAPGVARPEPGGLTTREMMALIEAAQGELVGAEIIGLDPVRDVNAMTTTLAARLARELAARMLGGD